MKPTKEGTPILPAPKCWCGGTMLFAGYGAFPYDCASRDKWPNAAIYRGCENDPSHGWCYPKVGLVYDARYDESQEAAS